MDQDIRLREIFHYCFLERLLRASDPGIYILKGGVNLRFFFRSPRYSEDMDLDVLAGSVPTLKKNGYKILQDPAFARSLRTYGVERLALSDPAKAKQTATTQRFRLQLVTTAGESYPTKIEFSRRAKNAPGGPAEPVDPEIARAYNRSPLICRHYAGSEAVVQKIKALAGRPAAQARDVFDLNLLVGSGHSAGTRIPEKLAERAAENTVSLDYDAFRGHVLEFIPANDRRAFEGPAAWARIQQTVLDVLTP